MTHILSITNIAGETEALTNIRGLTRTRKVNGEKSLAFFVIPDASNAHSFGMVDTESTVEFDGEEYVIKTVSEKNVGLRSIKEVGAVHKFFCDMIDDYQYDTYTGSMTFNAALNFVFGGTGYTFNIIDSFTAETFDNFGDDNRLALFQTILERYGAEFYVNGTQVNLKREIGVDTDFQYRYAHNVKTLDKKIDSTNLATYVRGYGKDIETEYTSPNAAVLGIRHAPAVRDDRYTTVEGLLARLQNDLKDEPDLSITIDFAELRTAGYLYEQPNEGDYGFIIYEPMSLDIEARIVEISEEFNADLLPIKTAVTLSNFREGITDVLTRFAQTSKQVNRLFNGQKVLPYNVLDEAVRIATEALQSAQTELEFNNGIIARDKTNPNLLVLFNSAGLGISTDGGQTFTEAITYLGVNTSLLTAGQINANNISVLGGTVDAYTLIDAEGLYVKGGAIQIERPDGYVVVNDGILQNGFAIQGAYPPYRTAGITEDGPWVKVNTTNRFENIQAYTFKHDTRYLVAKVGIFTHNGITGYLSFDLDTSDGAGTSITELATVSRSGDDDGWTTYVTMDLGVPEGSRKTLYVRMYGNDPDWFVFGRILYICQEG
ncbi:phage tail protein [Bacillus sp. 03113]|uniref:phage tail protein n=1 Tax=Bacillus sp. 03113 TaxID=2578211 RepID=UPI001142F763|nr:phage tail protein [Bacillus sp. 03113]